MSSSTPSTGIDLLIEALLLDAGYNSAVAMLGSAALGIGAGTVGVFAMLRRRSLLSDALAHSMFPGICLAFMVGSTMGWNARSLPVLMTGAALTGALGALTVRGLRRVKRFTDDLAMAIVLAVYFGLGAILLSVIVSGPTGNRAGLGGLLLGQAASMLRQDAILIGVVAAACIGVCAMLFKELRLLCFDDRFAQTTGLPARAIDLTLLGLILLITVIGLQSVGLVMVVALLIIPASTARLWTDRLWLMTLIASAAGGASAYVGAGISRVLAGVPTGATIVLVAGAMFILSLLISPLRGVLGVGLQRLRMRARIASDHVLRHALEQSTGPSDKVIVRDKASLPVRTVMRLQGLVTHQGGGLVLTQHGLAEAHRLTEAHELWERYLEIYAGFGADRVHQPADMVEHVLSDELTAALRERVQQERVAGAGR